MTSKGIAHELVHCSGEFGNSVLVRGVHSLGAARFRRTRYEDGHQCTSGRCPYESPSGSLAPFGCRAACATRSQFKRKSQTQEKRSEQSIAPDRLRRMQRAKRAAVRVRWQDLAMVAGSRNAASRLFFTSTTAPATRTRPFPNSVIAPAPWTRRDSCRRRRTISPFLPSASRCRADRNRRGSEPGSALIFGALLRPPG